MYKSLVLAIFALIGSTTAKWSFGWCPEPELQVSFDVNQYLGTWYEYARDDGIIFEYGGCSQARYDLRSDGLISVQNSLYNDKTQKIDSVKGSAECNGPKCKVGFFLFRNGDYRVVSTDYTNYSIVYSCTNYFFLFKKEYIWILSRTATPDSSTVSNVNSIIQTRIPDYEFSNFEYPVQGGNCQYLP